MRRVFSVAGKLKTNGRLFENENGVYRPNWCGALSILPKPRETQTAYLDWVVASGFNGVRIFCGELAWSQPEKQTLNLVYDNLPFVLDEAATRGLYVEVTIHTDSANGYDIDKHSSIVGHMLQDRENCVIEIANEPYHGTQANRLHDPLSLGSLQRLVPSLTQWAMGASADDESDEFAGGSYVTVHMDRGRDKWNMVRRVRELENLSAKVNKPVLNNEAIKFGSQMNDPAIAFTMSVLNRGFEIGGILHCDDALTAAVPFNQQDIADAWVAGFNCVTTKSLMRFSNATWADSPVKSANFDSDIVRAYSFLSDEQNVLVEVGVRGDGGVQFNNGWQRGDLISEVTDTEGSRKCRVFNLIRG